MDYSKYVSEACNKILNFIYANYHLYDQKEEEMDEKSKASFILNKSTLLSKAAHENRWNIQRIYEMASYLIGYLHKISFVLYRKDEDLGNYAHRFLKEIQEKPMPHSYLYEIVLGSSMLQVIVELIKYKSISLYNHVSGIFIDYDVIQRTLHEMIYYCMILVTLYETNFIQIYSDVFRKYSIN
jgi:hypothetical protein